MLVTSKDLGGDSKHALGHMLSPWQPPWREPLDEPEPAAEESLGETEHLKGSVRTQGRNCPWGGTLHCSAFFGELHPWKLVA